MSFQFPLATVLRVRGVVEEKEERMLQQINAEITQTREVLEHIAVEIKELDALRGTEVFKSRVGLNIHASYGRMNELKQNRKMFEEQLVKLEELRDRQIAIYEAARRNREVLTNMHDEKRTAYESGLARNEQKTIDDNHIARRGRV
jgi:flagellar export protein FliJ